MLTAGGLNAPAPWVPYTRAGCNFGAVATANTVLENIATDIPTVFGPGSPQAAEVSSNPGQAFADFSVLRSTVGPGTRSALPQTAANPMPSRTNRAATLATWPYSGTSTSHPRSTRAGH